MPFATSPDGTRLFYKDIGTGAPLLLLHSWALHSGMWEYQLHPLLQAGYRIVALDRRGHGRSDYASSGYDFDTLTTDITAVLDHARVDEHAVLAHSTGAMEAIHLASRRGRVRAMVLLAPFGPNLDGDAGRAPLDDALASLRTDRPRYFQAQDDAYFARPRSGASDALLLDTLVTILRTPLEVATTLMTSAWTTDLRAEAAALSMPVLILHGDSDASAPLPITGQRYAELMPTATLTVYTGGPHGLYATHQTQVNHDIVTFLERHVGQLTNS